MATAVLIGTTLLSTGAGMYAQKSAQNAADAASENQQNLLARRAANQRQALVENTSRQQANKARQMARLRVAQAASGFVTGAGTPLAILGDMESRMDEQINETTNRALDAIGNNQNQISNLQFGDRVRTQAGGIERMAIGVQGATQFGSGYASNYDRYGSDPFSIFN